MIRYYSQANTFYIIPGVRILEDQLPQLQQAFEIGIKTKAGTILIDCRELEQLCAAGITLFVQQQDHFEKRRTRLGFFGIKPKILTVLENSGVIKHFFISASEPALRKRFQQTNAFPLTEK